MNSKLLVPLIALALISGGISYGTFAFFVDTESSSSNIFTAGTLDLTTDGIQGTSATIGDGTFAPGDTSSGSIVLARAGTLSVVDLDFGISLDVTDDDGASGTGGTCDAADQMDKYLTITTLTYDGGDVLSQVTDADTDGRISIDDLEALGALTDLADPGTGGKTLAMTVEFAAEAHSCTQNDSVDMTLNFLLAQVDATDLGGGDSGGGGGGPPAPIGEDAIATMGSTLPVARRSMGAAWVDDRAYLFGGYDSGGYNNQIVKYVPSTDTATTLSTTLPWDASGSPAVYAGSYIYIFGSGDTGTSTTRQEILRFDPSTETLESYGTFPAAIDSHQAVWTGTDIVILGVRNSPTIYQYDPVANSASTMSAQVTGNGNDQEGAFWDGTHVYVLGRTAVERYDPAADTISTLSTPGIGRYSFATIWDGEKAYLFGGADTSSHQRESIIQSYDPATDTLSTMSSVLPVGRHTAAAVWADNAAYVFGGLSPSNYLNDILKYT